MGDIGTFLPGYGLAGRARLYEIVRCALFWACVLLAAYWAADRTPPLVVRGQVGAISVERGSVAQIELSVQRNVRRNCSVSYHRHLYDADGFRFDLPGSPSGMNAEAIAALERSHPGRLLLLVPIPRKAAPGPVRLVTSMQFVCNPLHYLWPIPMLVEVPLQIH